MRQKRFLFFDDHDDSYRRPRVVDLSQKTKDIVMLAAIKGRKYKTKSAGTLDSRQ